MRQLIFMMVLGLVGCGRSVRPEFPESQGEGDLYGEGPAGAPVPGTQLTVAAARETVRSSTGVLRRAELVAVLDRGPGAFLSGVDVQPAFAARRFAGWQVIAFWPDEPSYRTVDLVPGDLVVAVNGKLIERPEELVELWQSLRTAPAIEVELVRSGERRKLLYTIEN